MNESQHQLADQISDQMAATESDSTGSAGPTDCIAPEGADEQPPVAPDFDPLYQQRRQRILDYCADAQAEPNSLLACLGGAIFDLFDYEQQVSEILRPILHNRDVSVDDVRKHSDVVELALRLPKQIAQIAQITLSVRRYEDRKADLAQLAMEEANESHTCAPNNPR